MSYPGSLPEWQLKMAACCMLYAVCAQLMCVIVNPTSKAKIVGNCLLGAIMIRKVVDFRTEQMAGR